MKGSRGEQLAFSKRILLLMLRMEYEKLVITVENNGLLSSLHHKTCTRPFFSFFASTKYQLDVTDEVNWRNFSLGRLEWLFILLRVTPLFIALCLAPCALCLLPCLLFSLTRPQFGPIRHATKKAIIGPYWTLFLPFLARSRINRIMFTAKVYRIYNIISGAYLQNRSAQEHLPLAK